MLNEYIWREILAYLDVHSIISLREASEFYADIIQDDARIMSRLPAIIGKSNSGVWLIDIPPGQIHTVELNKISKNDINELLQQKLSLHFNSIKKLAIRRSTIGRTELCKFMNQLINLMHLTIFQCNISNKPESSDGQIMLEKLESLTVENDWSIFDLLGSCQAIKSVTVGKPAKVNQPSEKVLKFLLHHSTITTLVIKHGALKPLIEENYDFPFQLSKLSIDYSNNLDPVALSAFLCRQKASLRELEVKRASIDHLWQCIIEELQVSKIQAGISNFESDENFDTTSINLHLKTLVLHGADKTMKTFKKVISQFPNLETLVFISWCSEDFEDLFDHIASTLPNLKHLSLPSLPGNVAMVHDFHSLKSLHVKCITEKNQIVNFKFILRHCPQLEILIIMKIKDSLISNSMLVFIVSHAKHLTELCLGLNFEYDADAFSIVHRLKNLKKLIVFTKKTEQVPFIVEMIRNNSNYKIFAKSDEKNFTKHFKLIRKHESVISDGSFNLE